MRKFIRKLVRAYYKRFSPKPNFETRKFPNGYHGEINDEWLRELDKGMV